MGSNVPPKTPRLPGRSGRDRGRRRSHGPPRAARSHSSSVAPIRTRSPGAIPARRSSSSMPRRARSRWNRSADSSTSKFVWAAIRSMRVPRTRKTPSASALDDEPVAHRLDAMDDDAGRLGWRRRVPRRPAAARRGGARNASRPSPGLRRDGRRPSGPRLRAGTLEGRPRVAGRGQVELVEGDEHRLLEQRRVVGSQLVADDLVVPLRVARRRRRRRGPGPASARRGAGTRVRGRRPALAPSMSPGTSAIVGRRSSSSPRSMTPRFGSSVVNG